MRFRIWGLGIWRPELLPVLPEFRVLGLGFRGLGFRGLGFRVRV